MKNWSKRLMIPVLFTLIVNSTLLITRSSKADYIEPFFGITLLGLDNNRRGEWISLIAEELPKIGIEVDFIDTDLFSVFRRSIYRNSYPIPTYNEGGYDVVFINSYFYNGEVNLDYNPKKLFDSSSINHWDSNFYQYSNSEMDWAIDNYSNSFEFSNRLNWAREIQNILYEDIPVAAILYDRDVYLIDENLYGFNPSLWYHACEPVINWSIPKQTELRYAIGESFSSFHPFGPSIFFLNMYYCSKDYIWLHQIYNSLVERNSTNSNLWSPWLCESYSSSDGLTYDVIIKEDARWADGVALTTDDVIFNYQLAVTLSLTGRYIYYGLWDNASITKINDKEFTITFFNHYITRNGGNLGLDLIPKHIWENISAANQRSQAKDWAKNQPEKIFGAGPYMLANYNENDSVIHLKRNPYFDDWAGVTPHFTDIYFVTKTSKNAALQDLELGEIDIIDVEFNIKPEELLIPGTRYRTFLTGNIEEMAINCLHPWIGTGENCPIAGGESARNVRKAINCLIPRQYIINEILDGFGDLGVTAYPSTCIGFNDTLLPYEYDLEKAKEYMEAVGFVYDYSWWSSHSPNPPNYFPLVVTSLCCFSSLLLMVLIFMSIHLTAIFRRKE